MIQVPLSQAKEQLASLLEQAATDDVVLTDEGRPVGVLIGFGNEDDWFDYRLENDPRFVSRIQQAREEAAAGRTVCLDELAG